VKRNWIALLGYVAVALLASPPEGWSRTSKTRCSLTEERVKMLLAAWGTALNDSTPEDPGRILKTYAAPDRATLLPTCSDKILTTSSAIASYFKNDFLIYKPKVQIDTGKALIGVACNYGFASGPYAFKVTMKDGNRTLFARYTYIFHGGEIVQHHSSLVPKIANNACP
jgi:hypothetical protein